MNTSFRSKYWLIKRSIALFFPYFCISRVRFLYCMVLLLYFKVVKIFILSRTLLCQIYLWAILRFVKNQLMYVMRSCFLVSVSNLMTYVCRRIFRVISLCIFLVCNFFSIKKNQFFDCSCCLMMMMSESLATTILCPCGWDWLSFIFIFSVVLSYQQSNRVIKWALYIHACVCMCMYIQGVSGGIVNILGGGSMDYSE